MLCKILAGEQSDIGLPPWLNRNRPVRASSVPPAPRAAGPALSSTAEAQELRSKVESLTAALDRNTKEAWEQGLRQGETAARQSLEAETRSTIAELAQSISAVASQRGETLRNAEADTVRLAIEIARRVLHREISVDPSALSALVGAALEKLKNQEIYRVRIHPSMEKVLKSSLEQFGRSDAIELIADPALPRGGVNFEISRGSLDASVDTQLREIERGLVDEMKTRS